MRWPILIGVLCHLTAAVGLASLRIDVSVRAADDEVWFGEVLVDGETLLRVRGTSEDAVRERADEVGRRLGAFALEGIRAADVTSETRSGSAGVAIKGQPLVSIDRELAELSGMSPQALAVAWERRLQDCFSETYLMLEPAELLVPYGEVRQVAIGGTGAGEFTCGLYAEDTVEVARAEGGAGLAVRGISVGSTAISVERGGHSGIVTVDVRKWAASIGESAEAVVTGGSDGNPGVGSAVMNAARAAARPEPDAVLWMGPPVAAGTGDRFAVSVEATGDRYIPARRDVQVRVVNTAAPGVAPAALLVSNDPELISAPGPLMVGELPGSQAVRLLYHHKNAMPRPCRLVVALDNASRHEARVHVTEAAAGPDAAELFVGRAATRRFAERVRADHGYVLRVPPGRRAEIQSRMIGSGEVVSGLARLTNLGSAAVRATVSAGGDGDAWGYFPLVPPEVRAAASGEDCSFRPKKHITASYTVGGAWLFVDIGREAVANRRGTRLHGNYGVRYEIEVQMQNPGGEGVRAEIAIRAGGGAAWGAFSIDGHTVETPLLAPGQERVLKTMALPPGASRTISVRTMPEAASSYPVTLIVRSR